MIDSRKGEKIRRMDVILTISVDVSDCRTVHEAYEKAHRVYQSATKNVRLPNQARGWHHEFYKDVYSRDNLYPFVTDEPTSPKKSGKTVTSKSVRVKTFDGEYSLSGHDYMAFEDAAKETARLYRGYEAKYLQGVIGKAKFQEKYDELYEEYSDFVADYCMDNDLYEYNVSAICDSFLKKQKMVSPDSMHEPKKSTKKTTKKTTKKK